MEKKYSKEKQYTKVKMIPQKGLQKLKNVKSNNKLTLELILFDMKGQSKA